MQPEETEQPGSTAENAAEGKSAESKPSKRGGKRPGAGRKPNLAKHLLRGVTRHTLSQAVQDIDVTGIVTGLLKSKLEIIRLQTLNFVFDRLLGKPKQDIGISGAMFHAHTRDPLLSALPKEALQDLARAYSDVLAKHNVPTDIMDASPDGPQNQIESNSCTETDGMVP